MKQELARALRHLMPVAVTYAVAKGYIPVEAAGHLTEALVILGAALLGLTASKARDVKRAAN